MNVLVVGATGDVGSEAAKIAVEKGHNLKALVRSTSNRDKLGRAKNSIEFFEGDMLDRASIELAMGAVEAVIISIRLNQEEMQKGRTFEAVEQDGVINVVEAAGQKGVKKIIFISADGVGPDCVSDMFQAKFQSEEAIRNSGMDYTIFRPSAMYKDFDFFHIPNVLKLGETDMWPMGPVEIHMTPLSHIDLAECMVDALTNPAASNRTLSIGGPESITQGELLNMIAKEAGTNAIYTRGVSKEQLIEGIKKNPRSGFFTPEQLQDFISDSTINHKPIKDIFNIEFQRVGDYIQKAVPKVKAALAQQTK
jgi:NADH dehydrogenase